MSRHNSGTWLMLACFLFLGAAGFAFPCLEALGRNAGSQGESLKQKQAATADNRTSTYYGTVSCSNCHSDGFKNPSTFICRGTELAIWQANDKHALAYKVLGDERAQRIGQMLGWNVKDKKECLTCHTVWFDEKPTVQKAMDFNRDEGVSCVVCHGPDVVALPAQGQLLTLGWLDYHASQNQKVRDVWRKLPRQDKQIQYGMFDLWDPVKRTQLCASCHIGSVEQGKVVTHEMYAAGHPPLPSFEVVTFCNQMPRHWQYLREKDKQVRDLVMKFSPSEVELEQTHLLAIGGLIAFREYMQLLAGQAAKDWPELANYSCYACHHELKSKSWRQERGYAGKPGRPAMREWPSALVELGLLHAARSSEEVARLLGEWQTGLTALQASFDSQPFGDRAKIKQRADEMTKWIDTQVKRIQERIGKDEKDGGYDTKASAALLMALINSPAKGPLLDFDSARQRTWAWQTLYLEVNSRPESNSQKAMETTPAWKALDAYLGLTLPPGKTSLEISFAPALDRVGQYDPREFLQRLNAVLKQLQSPP